MRGPAKSQPARQNQAARVVAIPAAQRSDEAVLTALRRGEPWAAAALLDRFGPLVARLLRNVLGPDPELADLTQDTFVTVLTRAHQVRDPAALKGWISSVAAHSAHRCLRRRVLRRWLIPWGSADLPGTERACEQEPESRHALRKTYEILGRMPAAERVAFALRHVDGMDLEEVAAAAGVSLATIKRRLARAERRFIASAKRDEVLAAWLGRSKRWRDL